MRCNNVAWVKGTMCESLISHWSSVKLQGVILYLTFVSVLRITAITPRPRAYMYMQCSAVSKAAKPTLHAASLVADRHVMFWFARWRLLSACVVYNTHQNGNSENRRREFQHRQDAFSVKIQNIHMSIRIQVADHFGGPGTADGRCLTCFCSCVVYLFPNRLLSRAG